ncbi:MAG: hypothetical protein ABFD64_02185 [Armatimonadota bacterium]
MGRRIYCSQPKERPSAFAAIIASTTSSALIIMSAFYDLIRSELLVQTLLLK